MHGAMASTTEMQPLAPSGYRRAPEMKEKVEASSIDLEMGNAETLYPGISRGENALRWGFIRKVYGILCVQLVLTTLVSAVTVFHPTLNATLSSSPVLALVLAVLPFILMIPLYIYQHRHPHNLAILGLFTLCLSFSIGVACANTEGTIVLQALVLTSAVVVSLTAYTFWAAKKGKEFSYLGPFLFSALTILVVISFTQIFFPFGPASNAVIGGFGALVFSGFIVYDTENLIKRHTYDEYIWASVELYLDILNLFLTILQMLKQNDN